MTVPVEVMRATRLSPCSVNQILLSGPSVIPTGSAPAANGKTVMAPLVVMRPTKSASASVNHRFPSAPLAI